MIKSVKEMLEELNNNAQYTDSIFDSMRVDPMGVQEETLLNILAESKDTEYGRKYDFAGIDSIESFRQKVPLSEYDDYRDYIERMKKGESDLLFPGKAHSFVVSTGTTGIPKYIPESENGAEAKRLIQKMRSVTKERLAPGLTENGGKSLAITNSSAYETTEGGIPCGSASGMAVNPSMQPLLVLPYELVSTQNLSGEARDYMTLLFSVASSSVTGMYCNNVAHFNLIMQILNNELDKIVNDIRLGTISCEIDEELRQVLLQQFKPNPERADELRKLAESGKLTIENIWPRFEFVGCWLSAGVGRSAKEFRALFPKDTKFLHWGYGSSESKFDIPIELNSPEGVLMLYSDFYEFLEMGADEPILLEQTSPDQVYELILTSYAGFYRYNIHDIVRVHKSSNGQWMIEFLCKHSDSVCIDEVEVKASDITKIVEEYEKTHDVFFRLYQARKKDNGLEIILEAREPDWCEWDDVKRFISDRLSEINVALTGIVKAEPGYRDSLYMKKMANGKTVNSTKLPVFIK